MSNTIAQLEKLARELDKRNYAAPTRKTYLNMVKGFLSFREEKGSGKDVDEQITDYILRLRFLQLQASTINLTVAAIKFYLTHVEGIVVTLEEVPYLKKPMKLPIIFSVEEMGKIFSVKMNPKHRLLLMLYYGCGLRLAEAVGIKIGDIRLDRYQIQIHGKGSKDRMVFIPPETIPPHLLELQMHGKGPDAWLIESEQTGGAISRRTAQKIFEHACAAAQVSRPWNVHRMRHSYATHLLENKTDVKFIQELLGHANIKTTMLYTHVTNDMKMKIRSPLADILQKAV